MQSMNTLKPLSTKDPEVFWNAYTKYHTELVNFVKKRFPDLDIEWVKDIVHNTFIAVFKRDNQFANQTALRAYIFKTLNNKCLNLFRAFSVERSYQQNFLYTEDLFEKSFLLTWEKEDDSKMFDRSFRKAMDEVYRRMPRASKVFHFRFVKGYDIRQTAECLGISHHTVKEQHAKVIKMLRKILAKKYPA